jgi:hypothetical protein
MTQPPRDDLFDPAFKANPYPTYSELRTSAPVHRITLPDGRGVWLVTRYGGRGHRAPHQSVR